MLGNRTTDAIKLFDNQEFGQLRVLCDEECAWFVGTDLCKILGLSNPSVALSSLDDDERSKFNLGRQGEVNAVSEAGLYKLIMRSRKPQAKEFQRWVTHEVLPSIRRTGGYMVAGSDETPEETMARALLIAKEAMDRKDARIAALEDKGKQDTVIIEAQGNVIGEMAPKALFADAVATSKSSILVGELAKILKQNGVKDMGQNRLFEWMRRKGYLMKQGSWYNMPTQKSMDLGLFEIKETSITHSDGHVTVNKTPKVTGKGQQYFVNKFLRGEE